MNPTRPDYSDRLLPPHNPSVVGSIPTGPTESANSSAGEVWCDLFKILANSVTLKFEVKARLKVHPETLARPKVPRHAKGSVGSDSPLAEDYLIDPPRRNTDCVGESILTELERLQKLLKQDLTRVNRVHGLWHHHSLVAVHNLDVFGPRNGPAKTNSPLVVDPNAVRVCAIAMKLLQSTARLNSQI
jgi:hypothetical protein